MPSLPVTPRSGLEQVLAMNRHRGSAVMLALRTKVFTIDLLRRDVVGDGTPRARFGCIEGRCTRHAGVEPPGAA